MTQQASAQGCKPTTFGPSMRTIESFGLRCGKFKVSRLYFPHCFEVETLVETRGARLTLRASAEIWGYSSAGRARDC